MVLLGGEASCQWFYFLFLFSTGIQITFSWQIKQTNCFGKSYRAMMHFKLSFYGVICVRDFRLLFSMVFIIHVMYCMLKCIGANLLDHLFLVMLQYHVGNKCFITLLCVIHGVG